MRSWRLLCLALAAAGCAGEGPTRHDVSGRVVYLGHPVPVGMVLFEPDAARGNLGQQGMATIENGSFRTSNGGTGLAVGAYLVTVTGYDRTQVSDDAPNGRRQFPPYTFAWESTAGAQTLDIDIPSPTK
jgi:hypothetical protein